MNKYKQHEYKQALYLYAVAYSKFCKEMIKMKIHNIEKEESCHKHYSLRLIANKTLN